ncbi:MAG: hypothetical protein HY885_08050 [Deltaproteobacteria bacterium]|nr:hypothetical protein [Deltaproteobacteria bacterium]
MHEKLNSDESDSPWRIPLISLILAVISVLGVIFIGFAVYTHTLESARLRYQHFYGNTASLIVQLAENRARRLDTDLLQSIEKVWAFLPGRLADEDLCVVDSNGSLIFHAAQPETAGSYCGSNAIFPEESGQPATLQALVKQQKNYAGTYIANGGEEQLAAFVALPGQKWILGLHRPEKAVAAEIQKEIQPFAIGFIIVGGVLMPVSFAMLYWTFYRAHLKRKRLEQEKGRLITDLRNALAEVKTLSGCLPICASCKQIRDDKGYWNQIESYLRSHAEVEFSHSICPDCVKKLYPREYLSLYGDKSTAPP